MIFWQMLKLAQLVYQTSAAPAPTGQFRGYVIGGYVRPDPETKV